MKKGFIILTLFFIVLQIVEAQNPFITNYTISDGLPSNDVFCAYQDKHGFMWFGTRGGVTRFDGNKFRYYTGEKERNGVSTLRIREDIEGRLWLFNYDGSLSFILNDKLHNMANTPFLRELKTDFYFLDFYQDKDSTLYFYNPSGEVFVVKNNELVDYNQYEFRSKRYYKSLLYLNKTPDDKFTFWSGVGLFQLKEFNDSLTQIPTELYPFKVFRQSKSTTFVLDQNNYVQFFKDSKLTKKNLLHLNSALINSIVVDDKNYMWILSYNEGVYCYKNDSIVLHLPIKYTQSIVFDDEDNIWVTSNKEGGVFKINRNILNYKFIDKTNFEGKGVTDLAASNKNGVWATNGESLFYILNKKIFPLKIHIGGGILDNVRQLRNNTIIVGGRGENMRMIKGVDVDEKKGKIKFQSFDKLNFRINSLLIDSAEHFLYSPVNNQLLKISLEKPAEESVIIDLKRGKIRNVFFNKKNELIVNSNKFYLYNDSIYLKKDYQQFNGKRFMSHLVVDKNNEVINLQGGDIYLLNGSSYFNLTKNFESQIDFQVKDMIYNDSTLFFFTMKSVYFVPDFLKIVKGKSIHLNRLNIEFNDINDVFCKNNTLYVASSDGITFIPINECVNINAKLPKSYIYKVSLNDREYNILSGVVKFKNKKRLSIEFSSLNYSSVPSNYSYKLEGIDKDWITGKETKVVYLNLAPGDYVFKVRSRKNREEYGAVAQLPVIVAPTLVQRPITKLFIVLLGIFFIFVIIRAFYKHKMKKKETDHLLVTLEHKALQSMMNPHFIFNALGSIQGYLLQNKSVEAGTYLSQFARLIRQNMSSLKSNSICIDDEIDRLRNYIELEKLRMNNNFEYDIKIDENLDSYDIYIPSMIIQPFVENAIWHGISSIEKGGMIRIIFNYNDEKSIEILVEDNGVGLGNEEENPNSEGGLHMGVSLTKKRLKLIGDRQGVAAGISAKKLTDSVDFPGTQIRIIIPIINSNS